MLNKCFCYNLSRDFSEGNNNLLIRLVKGNGDIEGRWLAQGHYRNLLVAKEPEI